MARSREFDEDDALEKALAVFWRQGYEATSIQDVVDATGVQRQSLYNTFGDKHALYLRALRRYAQHTDTWLDSLAAPGRSPLRVVRDLLMAVVDDAGDECRGCMLVNASLEQGGKDAEVDRCVRQNIGHQERVLGLLLERARDAGEIAADAKLKSGARELVALVWGLRALGRVQRDPAWLRSVVDQALARLRAG